MKQNFNRITKLILLVILFQFALYITQIPFIQNGLCMNISSSQPMNFNKSNDALGWVDERGAYIPSTQDYLVIGSDKRRDNNTFKILVIGDSIAWGAGLEQNDKYYQNIADYLKKELKRPIEVNVLAHTGAALAKPKNIESNGHKFINPELSSWDPTLLEQAGNVRDPEDIDLILLSGGINDIGINVILNPLTSPDEIRSRCINIEDPLKTVLVKLLDKCNRSNIIITSYYPIVTNDTSEAALNIFLNTLKKLAPNSIQGKGFNFIMDLFGIERILLQMSINSKEFDNYSRLAIGRAIYQANQYSVSHFKKERVFFAPIDFPSNRSYGTNESWLWELTDPKSNNGKLTNDNRYDYRVFLCMNDSCDWKDIINAIGHPNVEGANEYNRTLIRSIIKIL